MTNLNDKQIIDYLFRSYTAVDGLWFMKLEERFDFDTALQFDIAVWEVLPKIQARKMKELKQAGDGIDALMDCFTERLKIEGFNFDISEYKEGNYFKVILNSCMWHNTMIKLDREHLSSKIGNAICNVDYGTWAKEFDCKFKLDDSRICNCCDKCILHFGH